MGILILLIFFCKSIMESSSNFLSVIYLLFYTFGLYFFSDISIFKIILPSIFDFSFIYFVSFYISNISIYVSLHNRSSGTIVKLVAALVLDLCRRPFLIMTLIFNIDALPISVYMEYLQVAVFFASEFFSRPLLVLFLPFF